MFFIPPFYPNPPNLTRRRRRSKIENHMVSNCPGCNAKYLTAAAIESQRKSIEDFSNAASNRGVYPEWAAAQTTSGRLRQEAAKDYLQQAVDLGCPDCSIPLLTTAAVKFRDESAENYGNARGNRDTLPEWALTQSTRGRLLADTAKTYVELAKALSYVPTVTVINPDPTVQRFEPTPPAHKLLGS